MKTLVREIALIRKSILFVVLIVFYYPIFSQSRITERFNDRPLTEVFDLFTKKYSIKFAYDNNLIQSVVVSGNFKDEPVEVVLKKILDQNGLEFLRIKDVFIIRTSTAAPEPVKQVKYKVLGVVKERTTGEALPYASISVVGTQKGTASNPDGYFSLISNQKDSITLSVSYIGFEPIQMKVAPMVHSDNMLVLELDRNDLLIKGTTITRNITDLVNSENEPGAFRWNSSGENNPPTISGVDIAAPLQFLPGIDGTTESLSGLMVRHSQSDKNLFIYDGFTIYHIDHFFGAFTSFNAKAIKDIRVIRGGFDSRWGGRASSVIEITGKTGNENKFIADGGADPLGVDVELEGPIGKKSSFVVAARRSFTDYYRSSLYFNLFESARSDISANRISPSAFSAESSDPVFYYYDVNTKLSVKPTSKDVISLSVYKGFDQLDYNKSDINPFIKENSNWGNMGMGLRWNRQWGSKFYHTLTAGASRYNLYYDHRDSTLRYNQSGNVTRMVKKHYLIDNKLTDYNANLQGQLKIGAADILEFGFSSNGVNISSAEGISHYITSMVSSIEVIDTLKKYNNSSVTLTPWIQNTISFKWLKGFKVGARINYHDLTNKYYVEPRAQLVIQPIECLTFKGAAGVYNQFVNRVIMIENGYYRNLWVVSDDDRFPVVKSNHLIGGFTYKSKQGLSVDLEGYLKYSTGISFIQTIYRKTGSGSNIQIKQERKLYKLNSHVAGFDLMIKKNWEKGQVWFAYTLSQALNQCDQVNGGNDYPALDDQRHEFKFVGVYNFKRWNFSLDWIYGSGKPWDEILLTSTYQLDPDYEKNSARLPAYHRMDIGISYRFKLLTGELQIGLKLFNLYNHKNTLSKPFELSDNLIEDIQSGNPIFQYEDIFGMGFTPTLFLNVKF